MSDAKVDRRCTWTPEFDRILKKLLAEGLSHGKIALEMGVTRNTICGRVWRLKRNGRL